MGSRGMLVEQGKRKQIKYDVTENRYLICQT